MRELTANDLSSVYGGSCMGWQAIGLATLSSAVALGSLRAFRAGSVTEGLQAAGACGLLTMITATGFVAFLDWLSDEDAA